MCGASTARPTGIKSETGPVSLGANTAKSSPFYRLLAERDYSNLIDQIFEGEREEMSIIEMQKEEEDKTLEVLASVGFEWKEDELAVDVVRGEEEEVVRE